MWLVNLMALFYVVIKDKIYSNQSFIIQITQICKYALVNLAF